MNAELYIKQGDKIYKSGGGSTAGFIKANSREELPGPNTVAEGTVALVPSSGGGGLPVVELSTEVNTDGSTAVLTEDEVGMIAKIGANSFALKVNMYSEGIAMPYVFTMSYMDMSVIEGVSCMYSGNFVVNNFIQIVTIMVQNGGAIAQFAVLPLSDGV